MTHHKKPDGSEEREELLDELEENHERSRREAAGTPETVEGEAGKKDRKTTDKKSPEPDEANPPRTTTGFMTSPKFGSAGSGGAELEPGPKKN
jgi:hypothetical protein